MSLDSKSSSIKSNDTIKPSNSGSPSSSVKAPTAVIKDPVSKKDAVPPSPTTAKPPSSPKASSSPTQNGELESGESSSDQEEIIDMSIFNQILELDEDETHDFSKEMVEEYYTQAAQTFSDMDAALEEKDLPKLSDLGHFFKGSSATLGITHVQSSCEKIQRYGQLRDEDKGVDLTDSQALDMIAKLIPQVKGEYSVAEKWMRQWYKDHSE